MGYKVSECKIDKFEAVCDRCGNDDFWEESLSELEDKAIFEGWEMPGDEWVCFECMLLEEH